MDAQRRRGHDGVGERDTEGHTRGDGQRRRARTREDERERGARGTARPLQQPGACAWVRARSVRVVRACVLAYVCMCICICMGTCVCVRVRARARACARVWNNELTAQAGRRVGRRPQGTPWG